MFTKVILAFLAFPVITASWVNPKAACNAYYAGYIYRQGCSGLVADLLGLPWQHTSSYGTGSYLGSNGNYAHVTPGTIVGYRGHVAVYIGYDGCECNFVDVNGPGGRVRCVKSGYGPTRVYVRSY